MGQAQHKKSNPEAGFFGEKFRIFFMIGFYFHIPDLSGRLEFFRIYTEIIHLDPLVFQPIALVDFLVAQHDPRDKIPQAFLLQQIVFQEFLILIRSIISLGQYLGVLGVIKTVFDVEGFVLPDGCLHLLVADSPAFFPGRFENQIAVHHPVHHLAAQVELTGQGRDLIGVDSIQPAQPIFRIAVFALKLGNQDFMGIHFHQHFLGIVDGTHAERDHEGDHDQSQQQFDDP